MPDAEALVETPSHKDNGDFLKISMTTNIEMMQTGIVALANTPDNQHHRNNYQQHHRNNYQQ